MGVDKGAEPNVRIDTGGGRPFGESVFCGALYMGYFNHVIKLVPGVGQICPCPVKQYRHAPACVDPLILAFLHILCCHLLVCTIYKPRGHPPFLGEAVVASPMHRCRWLPSTGGSPPQSVQASPPVGYPAPLQAQGRPQCHPDPQLLSVRGPTQPMPQGSPNLYLHLL